MILTPLMKYNLAVIAGKDYDNHPDGLVIDAANDLRAVLFDMGDYIIVSIRGTEVKDADNLLIDIDALPASDPAIGQAPRGFLGAALALAILIAPHIEGRRLVFTGHSLGGSVAILLAALSVRYGRQVLAYAAYEPAATCTDETIAVLKGVEGFVSRYGNDPIPELPPGYQHPCAVTKIGHDMLWPFHCHSIEGVIEWMRGNYINTMAAAA